ncbi:hypothetical protein ACFL6C_11800, partial [Myxococcota bacterium]
HPKAVEHPPYQWLLLQRISVARKPGNAEWNGLFFLDLSSDDVAVCARFCWMGEAKGLRSRLTPGAHDDTHPGGLRVGPFCEY